MPTIYELGEIERHALNVLAEHGGDMDEPEVLSALEQLDCVTVQIENKCEAYCKLIKEMEAQGEARKAEAVRMRNLADTDLKAAKALRSRMLWFMESSGKKKVDAGKFRVKVQKNSGPQPIDVDEDRVPPPYLIETVVQTIDTARIREELAEGEDLKFARIMERGTHVRIK